MDPVTPPATAIVGVSDFLPPVAGFGRTPGIRTLSKEAAAPIPT